MHEIIFLKEIFSFNNKLIPYAQIITTLNIIVEGIISLLNYVF